MRQYLSCFYPITYFRLIVPNVGNRKRQQIFQNHQLLKAIKIIPYKRNYYFYAEGFFQGRFMTKQRIITNDRQRLTPTL